MVDLHLARRGIDHPRVLDAFRRVPREEFLDPELREFAYRDSPLPIGRGQTISQPYIVALMAQAAEIEADDRVLEIGAGSGYAAAVLGELAEKVVTIDRHPELVRTARQRLERLGYDQVRAEAGDGTLGFPAAAPYDAILVAAGGPEIPAPLLDQLAPGGRLVIPVGTTRTLQQLVRVRKDAATGELRREELGGVRFVPLVGEAGWGETESAEEDEDDEDRPASPDRLTETLRRAARELPPVDEVESDHLADLLGRIGDARVVLLGEATHGTSEFYRLRARITRELLERRGFSIVAVEADWPDASALDRYVRDLPGDPPSQAPFQRFPTWMWANKEVLDFVHWLRRHNQDRPPAGAESVGFSASTSTACRRRSTRWCATWTTSIPRPGHGGGGERLGRTDGGEDRPPLPSGELRAPVPRHRGRALPATSAPRRGPPAGPSVPTAAGALARRDPGGDTSRTPGPGGRRRYGDLHLRNLSPPR